MRLLKDLILVEPIVENKTETGIEIPMNTEDVARGVVLDVAANVKEIKKGDTIAHNLAYDPFGENRLVYITDVYCVYEEGDC